VSFASTALLASGGGVGQGALLGDHLGSATLTTDASGNRVGELRYTPYGVTRYEWGSIPTNRRGATRLPETARAGDG